MAIAEIQREVSLLVLEVRARHRFRTFFVVRGSSFALHEYRFRAQRRDFLLGPDVGLTHILQGCDERSISLQSFVPPSLLSRERRIGKDLVDGSKKCHP